MSEQPINATTSNSADTARPPYPLPPMPQQAVPQQIIIKQSGGWLRFFLSLGLTAGFFLMMFMFLAVTLLGGLFSSAGSYYDTTGGISEKFHSGSTTAESKIAIIKVTGVIMEGDGFVKHQIDKIRDDENVKAVIVRIDTPGGTVTGSDYIFHHLTKLREEKKIPLLVSMGSMATSGGYYVAMAVGDQEQSIYAEPTTTTGSIGVIMPHYDLTGLMEKYEIVDDSIVTHDNKQMTSMTRKLTPEKRAILQNYIDQSFARFKDIVKEGRPQFRESTSALDQLATGEIFTAPAAKESGLIDEIGFIEEVIERAAELAGLSEDEYSVVQYNSPASLFGDISLMRSQAQGPDLSLLMELSTPRAYYMNTTLPLLLSTDRLRD